MSAAIFLAAVSAHGPGRQGREVDAWYANRYLPAVSAHLQGPVHRFASPAHAAYVTLAELPAPADRARAIGLASMALPAPAEIARVEQFVADPIGARKRADAGSWAALVAEAPVVYAIQFTVPPERETEFNRWYDEEHIDMLLACPDWLACRRFRIATPHPRGRTHLALHSLADLRALDSPAREAAVRTPWRDRLVAEGWFHGDYRLCHRLVPTTTRWADRARAPATPTTPRGDTP